MTNQVSRINIFYLFFFLGEQSTGQFDWGFSKRGFRNEVGHLMQLGKLHKIVLKKI